MTQNQTSAKRSSSIWTDPLTLQVGIATASTVGIIAAVVIVKKRTPTVQGLVQKRPSAEAMSKFPDPPKTNHVIIN